MIQQFRILVIDDNRETLDMMELVLQEAGFETVLAQDPSSGLRAVYQDRPDAVLLDVVLPDMDGFEVCRRIRELADVPILFYTGKAIDPEDIVRGFAAGADDYVTKPFRPSELVSRLYARLRSANEAKLDQRTYLSPDASVMLNSDRREAVLDGRHVYLPPKEFRLLELLLRHAGQVLSPNAILAQVWGTERIGQTDLVKQCVYRLRRKIEPNHDVPRYIHSVRGEGYYFEVNDD